MGLALNGRDMVARAVGGDTLGYSGTATGTTVTSLTDSGASFTASSGGPPALGGLVGHVVVSAGVYGTIISNTTTALTVDQWHSPTAPETVGSTPGNVAYVVVPGGFPAADDREDRPVPALRQHDRDDVEQRHHPVPDVAVLHRHLVGIGRQRGDHRHRHDLLAHAARMATYTLTGHPLNYTDLALSSAATTDMIEAAMTLVEVGDTITITLSAPDETKLKASGCLR
jgi:hypothetical protein